MSEDEPQGVGLIQNLGTSPDMMAQLQIDYTIFGISEKQSLPFILWLDTVAGAKPDGSPKRPAYRRLLQNLLKVPVTYNGRGRNDSIRGESVMKGQPANIEQSIQKPNWLARNTYDRNWEQREKEKLGLE